MSQTFKDLRVYKIAFKLAGDIEKLTQTFPRSELFRETDQILRSSKSIVANIAEGFGRRKYKADFIKFLTYSISSCDETLAHLHLVHKSGFIPDFLHEELSKQYKNLAVRIYNYISVLSSDLKSNS